MWRKFEIPLLTLVGLGNIYTSLKSNQWSVINGGWQKAKIPSYKHAIAPYGTTMVGLPLQIWRLAKNPRRHSAMAGP